MRNPLKALLLPAVLISMFGAAMHLAHAQIPADVMTRYTVVEGDALSSIAGQNAVYGDADLWPLVFKYNTDKLTDPDDISPGMVLVIPRNLTESEISAASSYAKKRMRTPPGQLRDLDLDYLQSQ